MSDDLSIDGELAILLGHTEDLDAPLQDHSSLWAWWLPLPSVTSPERGSIVQHERIAVRDIDEFHRLYDLPLDEKELASLDGHEKLVRSMIRSTSNYRKLHVSWIIQAGELFIKSIEGRFKLIGEEPLKADWFSGRIVVGEGEIFSRTMQIPVYDVHRILTFKDGALISDIDFFGRQILDWCIRKEYQAWYREEKNSERRAPSWIRKRFHTIMACIMASPGPSAAPRTVWLRAVIRRVLIRWSPLRCSPWLDPKE